VGAAIGVFVASFLGAIEGLSLGHKQQTWTGMKLGALAGCWGGAGFDRELVSASGSWRAHCRMGLPALRQDWAPDGWGVLRSVAEWGIGGRLGGASAASCMRG
jgi:hypothetical protein